jgi:alginate O-acetyltransferase complex protein AlgI
LKFHSPEFVVLFSTVLLLYFNLPTRFRNPLLLAASAAFYMWWRPEYVLLVLFSVTVDYFVAFGLVRKDRPSRRHLLLVTSLVTNLGLLFFFKYYEFAADSLRASLHWVQVSWRPPVLDLILPVGISFHTFQALSYTIDVYQGKIPVQRSLPRLWLYVLFFPQLVAGPIERAPKLLPQFDEVHAADPAAISAGLKRILWGLVKKVAIADRLAVLVDAAYAHPGQASGATLVIATYAFAFQIYADFSGYTDIAIGTAQTLGFRLSENFNRPYLAASPSEFWRRWHITLSTWFRDYVYIPLGGSKSGSLKWGAAVLVTFLLSGLWHGAKSTFLIWGAYHGALLVLSRVAGRWKALGVVPVGLRVLVTFHLVLAGWVFFRAESLADAGLVYSRIFAGAAGDGRSSPVRFGELELLGILALLLGDLLPRGKWPFPVRWTAYIAGALLVLNARPAIDIPFIYYQF